MIRTRAIVWAAVSAATALAALWVFSRGGAIETNLLALLPSVERNPIAERAAAKVGEAGAGRCVFLIGAGAPDAAKNLSRRFERAIAAGGAFREVHAEFPAPDPRAIRDFYASHRFHLLSENDRRALADVPSGRFIEERLRRRLYDPFRATLGLPLEQDPLGLLDNYLTALPYSRLSATLEFDDGFLLARDADRVYAVVLAEVDGSPHDPLVQRRVEASLQETWTTLRALDAEATMLRAGLVHYAAAARETAEREVDRIAVGSLAGIVALLLLVFRSLRPLLLGLVSVVVGVCAAALATAAVFGKIHLITLVFGASLIGEAIDYSIQYFAARLDSAAAWEPWRGLRAVFPGVTIAVLTSVLGYGALAASPFPALRQIALFSIVGLLMAYLTVVLLIPAFARAPARYQPRALLQAAAKLWERCERLRNPRARTVIVAILVLASLPGWMRLTAADDIRLLVNPHPSLLAEEAAVRRLTGFTQGTQFFVIEGDSVEAALQREEALTERLRELVRSGALTQYQAASDFVPSIRRQQETYALWREGVFAPPNGLVPALAKNGFRGEVTARYIADFRRSADRPLLTIEAWLQSPAAVPFRHLWLGQIAGRYVSIVMPAGFSSVDALAQAARDLPGVDLADKAGDVSRLFREYRRIGSAIFLVAAVLIYAVLGWRYGPRQALAAMLPTLTAVAVTLGYCGYASAPLTLFNVMALLLVLGVGINYVIFLHEGIERRAAALVGVLLSAATTLLSFGLLGWSTTPALSQFGATLFTGIVITVVLAPMLGPSSTRARR